MTRFELTPEVAKEYRDRYGLRYFIETGIGQSDTRAYNLAPLFRMAWALEVDPETCAIARERSDGISNLVICEGSSPESLQKILPLDGPCLYWLDAHWVGGGERPAIECPLLAELAVIGRHYRGDVVLIDDARQFTGVPTPPHDPAKWPSVSDIVSVTAELPVVVFVDRERDLIEILPEVEGRAAK